jgi:hypothetical protein
MAAIADHAAYERLSPFIKGARSTVDFYINGTKIELSNPDPEHTLLDFLRSQPGLKGTKLGCGEGGWYGLPLLRCIEYGWSLSTYLAIVVAHVLV